MARLMGCMSEDAIAELREFLDAGGDVRDRLELLKWVWSDLDGGDETSMAGFKLDRMEDVSWRSPVLSFVVERHGAASLGSRYAEKQGWVVDLEARTARHVVVGRRAVRSGPPRLDVDAIVVELLAAVAGGGDDPRVRWSADRASFRLLSSVAVDPDGFGLAAQTRVSRSRRLRKRLDPDLRELGWVASGGGWYRRVE